MKPLMHLTVFALIWLWVLLSVGFGRFVVVFVVFGGIGVDECEGGANRFVVMYMM